MKHPAYHLRLNKAVDRFLLIDVLRILRDRVTLADYTYYGFGGPFLEDCRLIHEYCPEMGMLSIESDHGTYKRQLFHRFASSLKLVNQEFADFLMTFQPENKQVFWLDYIDMEPQRFGEFMAVLGKVSEGSIVRLSLSLKKLVEGNPFLDANADSSQKSAFIARFESDYGPLVPSPLDEENFSRPAKLVRLVQRMVRIQAEKALKPAAGACVFQPLSTTHYSDGTDMLSVTGIVWPKKDLRVIKDLFRQWRFANLTWKAPYEICVPLFSVKERLRIEPLLPLRKPSSKKSLIRAMGYSIVGPKENWGKRLEDYAAIHRYCPAFAKIVV